VDQVERVAPARLELWQSKTFLTGAVVAGFLVLVAALAPLLTAVTGQDYLSFHLDRLDLEGMPLGGFGGISSEHWLGVEPTTGRDVFAEFADSLRFSLGVALGAAVVEVLLGLLVAASVRRGNVRRLLGPALMYGALLVPFNLVFEVRRAFQGNGLRHPPAPSWGGMLSNAVLSYHADPAFLLVPGLLLVVTVLAFLLLADGLRRRFVAW
jgi:ABC-type dipeptide/oligopeptide/nickel transport system permease subunit